MEWSIFRLYFDSVAEFFLERSINSALHCEGIEQDEEISCGFWGYNGVFWAFIKKYNIKFICICARGVQGSSSEITLKKRVVWLAKKRKKKERKANYRQLKRSPDSLRQLKQQKKANP